MQLKVIRQLKQQEVPWISPYELVKINSGDPIFEYTRETYGLISPNGMAVTFSPDGDYPFFEVPAAAVKQLNEVTAM